MSADAPLPMDRLARTRMAAIVVGGLGLAGCIVGVLFDPAGLFSGYLFAVLCWIMLPLGCLAILMLHYLTGGRWGVAGGRTLRAGAATLPLLAVLFVPLFFGLETIFSWVNAEPAELAHVVSEKRLYLDGPFLIARSVGYFVVWLAIGRLVHVWTDIGRGRIADDRARSRRRAWSAFGLILWGLAITFFAVDWIMALEAKWYSTMLGFLIAGSTAAAAFALLILSTSLFGGWVGTPAEEIADRRQDLSNFLLAFTLVWFYLAYMQFLIIWSGNLPHEIVWYVHRSAPGWSAVIVLIAALHFAVPFAMLISPAVKRSAMGAGLAASLLLIGHALHVYWTVIPAFHHDGIALPWSAAPAFLGVGGVWLFLFLWLLEGRALWPFRTRRQAAAHA